MDGVGCAGPCSESVPDFRQVVAFGSGEGYACVFFEDVVKDLTVDVVEVCPREFASVYTGEHVEGPDAPVGSELNAIDVRALLCCNSFDFILNRAAPVENGSAYVPCEGSYV